MELKSVIEQGFTKRAQDYGLTTRQANELVKDASIQEQLMQYLQQAGDTAKGLYQDGAAKLNEFSTAHPEAYQNTLGGLAGAGVGAAAGGLAGGRKGALGGAALGAGAGALGTSAYNNPEMFKALLGNKSEQSAPTAQNYQALNASMPASGHMYNQTR